MPDEFGDVVLVPFPFTNQAASKRRLAVIVSSRPYNLAHPHHGAGLYPQFVDKAAQSSNDGKPSGKSFSPSEAWISLTLRLSSTAGR